MNRCIAAIALWIVALGATPTDELNRLAGTWQSQGTFVETPYSSAGPASGTAVCAWSNDRVFMICQQSATLAGKRDDNVAIYSYDDSAAVYRFYNVHSDHMTSSAITVDAHTITYPFSFSNGGQSVNIRTINEWTTPNSYNWRTEYSIDAGSTWMPMASGTSQRSSTP
jgi:hypothetical protein